MEYCVSFNQTSYIKKNKLRWRLVHKRKLRASAILFCISIIVLTFSFSFDPKQGLINILLQGLYSFFIINFIVVYIGYLNGVSAIRKNAQFEGKLQLNRTETIKWEFEEEYFRYQDSDMDYKISWRSMNSYVLYSHHLFILPRGFLIDSIVISEEQIGSQGFAAILELIKRKLRRSSPTIA